jgi:predicted Rossmann fold nucleotide-binding protein DprA/Smf involved in DNA uptake
VRSDRVLKIVSGGQTGVDRAALDAALELGIPVGGWCPRRRIAEDGPIAARYPLRESASTDYAERTRLNVRDSDGTLVLFRKGDSAGTEHTKTCAMAYGRPLQTVDPERDNERLTAEWILENNIQVLNVAGPRESEDKGVYEAAHRWLTRLFAPVAPDR